MESEDRQKQINFTDEKILSISEYIDFLNTGLKEYRAKIIGEVSEAKMGPTGHVYFSLKDEKDGSTIGCIIWRSKYQAFGIQLKEGVKIIASGGPEVYAPSGRLSFITDTIELAGEGALKKEYERLKEKLAKEGIFEEAKKRPIPKYAQKIGLITSKQGAVISDFLSNIGNFGFDIKMIDSRVEGQAAVEDLLGAIRTFKKKDIDVLVIMRGGGSLESMMAFNNELLVREAAGFPVPVIAAIGHDKDVPLLAMGADLAVSTPSIAATTLNDSWKQALLFLERYERNIIGSYGNVLDNANSLIDRSIGIVREAGDSILGKYKKIKDKLMVSLQNFKNTLSNAKIKLNSSLADSFSAFARLMDRTRQRLEYAEKAVNLNNPERQLQLGYSIASRGGRIIRYTSDARIGEDIDIRVTDGTIISEVKKINK